MTTSETAPPAIGTPSQEADRVHTETLTKVESSGTTGGRASVVDTEPQIDLAAVHQWVSCFLSGIGAIPMFGSPEWAELADNDRRKVAAAIVAAMSRLALPADVAGDLQRDAYARTLKRVSEDLSGAEDWNRIATVPTWAELDRRRAEPGSVYRVDRAAMRRWVATGHSYSEGRHAG